MPDKVELHRHEITLNFELFTLLHCGCFVNRNGVLWSADPTPRQKQRPATVTQGHRCGLSAKNNAKAKTHVLRLVVDWPLQMLWEKPMIARKLCL